MNNTIRSKALNANFDKAWSGLINQRGKAFGIMIIGALVAFEIFNYSTTEFALSDVLGDLKFAGIGWATILSIAFCGIDFAGIARLFTPEQGADEPAEVWYLFGAWLLAAAMNASLTWWGVSVAIANHTSQGAAILPIKTIQTIVPIFVAIMVWVIRVLIISTFSLAGDRMFSQTGQRTTRREYTQQPQQSVPARNDYRPQRPAVNTNTTSVPRPAGLVPASSLHAAAQPKPLPRPTQTYQRPEPTYSSDEPTYQNLMSARALENSRNERS